MTQSLLEKLDNKGTLFIENVENLSLPTQEMLSQFIASGIFRRCKSEHTVLSNVRIICSSALDLLPLVEIGSFKIII